MSQAPKAPSTYALWQKWAKILARQLARANAVYEQYQEHTEFKKLKAYLERLDLFIDPASHAQELAKRNYDVKGHVSKLYVLATQSLAILFREALTFFPQLSEDMQRILKSPCFGNCNGRIASDIFKGPHGSQNEGISSGVIDERGGLAYAINKLVEEAEVEGDAYFSKGLTTPESQTGQSLPDGSDQPDRHEFHQKRRRITATGVQ